MIQAGNCYGKQPERSVGGFFGRKQAFCAVAVFNEDTWMILVPE